MSVSVRVRVRVRAGVCVERERGEGGDEVVKSLELTACLPLNPSMPTPTYRNCDGEGDGDSDGDCEGGDNDDGLAVS